MVDSVTRTKHNLDIPSESMRELVRLVYFFVRRENRTRGPSNMESMIVAVAIAVSMVRTDTVMVSRGTEASARYD